MWKSKGDPVGRGGLDCPTVAVDPLLWVTLMGEAWGNPCRIDLFWLEVMMCLLKLVPAKILGLAAALQGTSERLRCLVTDPGVASSWLIKVPFVCRAISCWVGEARGERGGVSCLASSRFLDVVAMMLAAVASINPSLLIRKTLYLRASASIGSGTLTYW